LKIFIQHKITTKESQPNIETRTQRKTLTNKQTKLIIIIVTMTVFMLIMIMSTTVIKNNNAIHKEDKLYCL